MKNSRSPKRSEGNDCDRLCGRCIGRRLCHSLPGSPPILYCLVFQCTEVSFVCGCRLIMLWMNVMLVLTMTDLSLPGVQEDLLLKAHKERREEFQFPPGEMLTRPADQNQLQLNFSACFN